MHANRYAGKLSNGINHVKAASNEIISYLQLFNVILDGKYSTIYPVDFSISFVSPSNFLFYPQNSTYFYPPPRFFDLSENITLHANLLYVHCTQSHFTDRSFLFYIVVSIKYNEEYAFARDEVKNELNVTRVS